MGWGEKNQRINKKTMFHKTSNGGAGVPNLILPCNKFIKNSNNSS